MRFHEIVFRSYLDRSRRNRARHSWPRGGVVPTQQSYEPSNTGAADCRAAGNAAAPPPPPQRRVPTAAVARAAARSASRLHPAGATVPTAAAANCSAAAPCYPVRDGTAVCRTQGTEGRATQEIEKYEVGIP